MKNRSLEYFLAVLFLALLANTGYVAAFSSPTVFYMTNVLGHVVLGAVLAIASLFVLRRTRLLRMRRRQPASSYSRSYLAPF